MSVEPDIFVSSVLAAARIIDDVNSVPYPENIQRPKAELNTNAGNGKFRYDRDFLLQFMPVCTKLNGAILDFTPPAAPHQIIPAAHHQIIPAAPPSQLPLHAPKATFGTDSPVLTAFLNKLTVDKFDSISDQIVELMNKSEKEKDGRTLIQVIRLVFEKATDDATSSEMYARLCRKMMEQISPKMQADGIKNAEGKPIAGGQLFRKYLLNRCQEDFECCWTAKLDTAAAAATRELEDADATAAGQQRHESDEYSAALKAKRQWLGLIKFISELFKLRMLTERMAHECVRRILGNIVNPDEDEIETLCMFFSTIGSLLETRKARAHMDVYFSRMKELARKDNVSSSMRFMLQDVVELRDRKWLHCSAIDVKALSVGSGWTARKLGGAFCAELS
ncbi:armadillo-type protein [Mycena sanguinolenta]|nr:armadillo-type protein [Mycena sanguinolenta]